MSTFFVVFSTYVVSWITVTVQGRSENTRNDSECDAVLSKVSLLLGALAYVLLLFIILLLLGQFGLVFWLLYSLKTAYELVHVHAFSQLFETLKNAFLQFLEKLKNAFLQFLAKLKNAVYGHQTQECIFTIPCKTQECSVRTPNIA
ncbi:hypothetical protein TorRG33x02_247280 [Trema orientale]|uniref:Uncharacterized protein n=1 Tax=Trema orientale TaxID=63057 RepID=A0A2P5DME0_TREOI|nr:hypothetical protein TorRG33x02_247280 [Trema orientale]